MDEIAEAQRTLTGNPKSQIQNQKSKSKSKIISSPVKHLLHQRRLNSDRKEKSRRSAPPALQDHYWSLEIVYWVFCEITEKFKVLK
ncbi:hypothetical protein [Thermoleptolyngbya sichuanensis]|uniref:hypothetical protein n=1 Tax=Thermoleptolyngbya sichuanensis TaxID=2885951 RepID=UPI00240D529C|nr:hypothetical protein [Thermoleptolyngbya sichuanensis]